MRKTIPWLPVILFAAVAACDSGNESPAGRAVLPSFEGAPGEWPANRADLIFLWESVAQNNAVGEGEDRRLCRVTPKGRARFFRNFEMDPGGGVFMADEFSYEILRRVLDAGGAFSVEALVTPARDQDGTILRNDTVGFFQRGGDFVITAAEPSPVSERVGALRGGVPAHCAAVFDDGTWFFYLDGVAVEGAFVEPLGEGTEDGGLRFGGDWDGKLMGIAIYGRALDAGEVAANHATWRDRIAKRPEVGRLSLRGKLVRGTPAPQPVNPDPYERALAGHTYEVEEVLSGAFEGERLQVMHWVILDGKKLKSFPREIGRSYLLELEPFAAHPQLESEPAASLEDDFNLQNYYDVATPDL